MADWYVSKTKWTAVTQWAASTTLSVGAIRRQLTGAAQYDYCCFRVTAITTGVTGSTEPAWPTSNNGTVVDGGVTWTNVTGQSAYGWTAPAGDIGTLTSNITISTRLVGVATQDNIWIDSTQSETGLSMYTLIGYPVPYGVASTVIRSVNTGGSVPPVQADYTPGATLAFSGGAYTQNNCNTYGVNYAAGGNIEPGTALFYDVGTFEDVTIDLSAGVAIYLNESGSGRATFRNLSLKTSAGLSHVFLSGAPDGLLEIFDSPNLFVGGNLPSFVFGMNGNMNIYCRGVDFSQITGTSYVLDSGYTSLRAYATFEECVIPLANITGNAFSLSNGTAGGNIVQCINCDTSANNTNYNSYKLCNMGALSTSASVYRSGGSSIEGTPISWQMIGYFPSAGPSEYTLDSFGLAPYDNQTTGSPITLKVEIIGTGTPIQTTDLELEMWYQGSATSPIGSRVTSQIIIPAAATALPTSGATWVGSPGGSAQYISVTLTPQKTGIICGRLRLHSAITMYFDPVPHT